MKIYLDTEFNEFKGELISMALVAENGEEFYEVLGCANPKPWVEAHVMPHLQRDPIEPEIFQHRLWKFLCQYPSVQVIADWPEDFKHFCEALMVGPGEVLETPPISMALRRDLSSEHSGLPHNALHDARAIADQDQELDFG
jgi:hypothetical protein